MGLFGSSVETSYRRGLVISAIICLQHRGCGLATERRHEEKPWQPKIGREREFNPFVNALDRSAGLENLPPLERSETGEDESIERDRVAGKSTCTKASVAPAERGSTESAPRALIEPAVRHAMIAQATYSLSQRRGFWPGAELADWLIAENEIDRILVSEQAIRRGGCG